MDQYRNTLEKQPTIYQSGLRYSTRFLNSQLIRISISRNCSNPILRKTNLHSYQTLKLRGASSSPPKQEQAYAHLKDTLTKLQSKIKKAQQILGCQNKNTRFDDLDYLDSLSEIESNVTKKNQYNYADVTDHSTKLISNISVNVHSNIMKSNKIKNQRENVYKKNQYENCSLFLKINKLYYISSIANVTNRDSRIDEHLLYSYKVFRNFCEIQAPEYSSLEDNRQNIGVLPKNKGRKTLLLDIDETILHCEEEPREGVKYDFELQVKIDDEEQLTVTAYIKLRPYALTFLKNMAQIFQIIAFTASHQSYANVVLDELDPQNTIFSHRMYRSSCHLITENIFTKDIRILNRKLENMVLVDNSPYSYIFQLQNAIPILPYHDGPDSQLPKLQKYLQLISNCVDVRELNKSTFKLHRYSEFDNVKTMIRELYTMK